MRQNTNILRNLSRDARGATAIEYGFLAALISIAFIMGAGAMGTSVNNLTQSSADEIDDVIATMVGTGGVGGGNGGGAENNRGNNGNNGAN